MAEYAPDAIHSLFDQIAAAYPSAQFAGIVGDSAHTYGYHRGGNYVGGGDYSMQYAQDYNGDGDAACGLDITCADAGEHYALSAAMLGAVGHPAMGAVREFYGSVDGWSVVGWDYTGGHPVTSDDSHLWHVHISLHRVPATDHAAMASVAAAITGGAPAPTPPAAPTWNEDLLDMIVAQDEQDGRLFLISGNTKLELPAGGGVNGSGSPGHGNLYADLVCGMTGQPQLVVFNHDLATRIPDIWDFLPPGTSAVQVAGMTVERLPDA